MQTHPQTTLIPKPQETNATNCRNGYQQPDFHNKLNILKQEYQIYHLSSNTPITSIKQVIKSIQTYIKGWKSLQSTQKLQQAFNGVSSLSQGLYKLNYVKNAENIYLLQHKTN